MWFALGLLAGTLFGVPIGLWLSDFCQRSDAQDRSVAAAEATGPRSDRGA